MKKETLGVDTIPNEERNASPNTLVTVFLGANLSLSVMVFGWLSILYGLGWWESVSAILVGTFLGAVFVASSSLLGWSGATNNSVASGAFFGVRGRLIASFVGLLLCMQYVALTIWTGGEAFAAGISRITNTESTNLELSIGYALIAVIVVVFAVFGYRWLLRVNQFVAPAMGVLIILSVIALWDKFDPAYAGTPDAYALGSFWPTWFLAVLTCGAAGPISYVTQTGDWSRYISEQASKRDVVLKTFYALTLGLSVPTLFGAFVAVAAFDEDSFVGGYVANSPEWLLVPLLLIAVIGSLGQGGINLYSMGLDLDAILPKLKRNQSTAVVALISTLLVFLGKFVYDAESAVTNSVLFLSVLATSWLSITLYMFAKAKGVLSKDSLQVFNAGQTGGQYWFRNGWNLKAVGAWITGSAVGILGISSVDYVGPIAEFLNGIDVSIPAAGISSILILSLFKAKGR
ncbi:MAG: cytosine permease [Actinobacteria bacterium]|nr:cytosine permease [Actinomycetota bacterium]